MSKIKVSEASAPVLDWMVAKCEGKQKLDCFDLGSLSFGQLDDLMDAFGIDGSECESSEDIRSALMDEDVFFLYSTDWAQGGPIIEEHGIHLEWSESHEHWLAYSWDRFSSTDHKCGYGDTALIAAMRCYVVSKLGEEVEVPEELV